MLHQCMRAYRRVNTYEHHMNCMSWRGEARPPSPSLIKNAFLSGLIGPLSSLHHAAGTWQEVLDVSDRRLGQVGHGAIAATGGAVVEKVADSGRRVLLEEIITGTEGFLGMKKYNRVNVREITWISGCTTPYRCLTSCLTRPALFSSTRLRPASVPNILFLHRLKALWPYRTGDGNLGVAVFQIHDLIWLHILRSRLDLKKMSALTAKPYIFIKMNWYFL